MFIARVLLPVNLSINRFIYRSINEPINQTMLMFNVTLVYLSISVGARKLGPPVQLQDPYNGNLGPTPSKVQGQSPWLGNERQNLPKAETLLVLGRSMEAKNLPNVQNAETQRIKYNVLSLQKK